MQPKILILDIETAPKVALVWRFFQENISPKQVLEHGHIMSFAAKWLGNDDVIYEESRTENDKHLIERLVYWLDMADIVVAHNGARFDLPSIRGRALVHGINPPSPVKMIDTYKVVKKEFSFPSNSLEYLTMVLDCNTKKGGHKKFPGFELWLECLRKNEEAWAELKEYNILDVHALEEVYLKLRPWITDHPNVAIYNEPEHPACPKCGSVSTQWRGYAFTSTGKYHRYQCNDCGGWGRSRYMLNTKNENLLGNAAQ
jgi:predicted RNA-binding Zn-ribbon protein involved in translation (DUF1610 family)